MPPTIVNSKRIFEYRPDICFLHQFCKLFQVTLHVHNCDVNLNIQIHARQLQQTNAFNEPGANPQTMYLYGPADTWEAPRIQPGRQPRSIKEAPSRSGMFGGKMCASCVCVFFCFTKNDAGDHFCVHGSYVTTIVYCACAQEFADVGRCAARTPTAETVWGIMNMHEHSERIWMQHRGT